MRSACSHTQFKISFLVFQDITYILYPTGMIISSCFLFLTLFVYLVDPDLHKPLFGKITTGFVLNNLVAYICLATNYILKRINYDIFRLESVGCVLLGYFTLYSFTTFMFWINAMAANIFFKFSALMSNTTDKGWTKFLCYALYAQVCFCLFRVNVNMKCQ